MYRYLVEGYSASRSGTQIRLVAYSQKVREKAMAPHSSTLAWKIAWTEEPGGLQSMGSQRVGHNRGTSLSLFTHWRRNWQPTPVFLPGESQGWGCLVGCHLWGHTESDTTEATQQKQGSSRDGWRLPGKVVEMMSKTQQRAVRVIHAPFRGLGLYFA